MYSLAGRYHRLSGHPRFDQTSQALFGHARGGYPHDLPSGLHHLAEATGGRLGDSNAIANDHTVLPYYLVFRMPAQRREAELALAAQRIGTLKSRLGLLASRFGAVCPLKACPDCLESDRDAFGTAYWRREHQLPGVWVCGTHGVALLSSIDRRIGRDRFGWVLPRGDDLEPGGPPGFPLNSEPVQVLASLTCDMVRDPALREPARVSACIHRRLEAVDLAKPSGELRSSRLIARFAHSIDPLREIREIAQMSTSDGAIYGHVLHVLRRPDAGHTLRHALVIYWLFGSWTAFAQHCDEQVTGKAGDRCSPKGKDAVVDPCNSTAIAPRFMDDIPASQAARNAGVSVVTVQASWASAGRSCIRRPKKLKATRLDQLVDDLASGMAKQDAAQRADVSAATVNRILRTEPGLSSRRRAAILAERTAEARSAWGSALAGSQSKTLARALEPAAYAWLHRNDRAWMEMTCASLPAPTRLESRVDWSERDRILSAAIEAAIALALLADGRSPKVIELCQSVPGLKAKLRVLYKLPRTSHLLVQMSRRRTTESEELGSITLARST